MARQSWEEASPGRIHRTPTTCVVDPQPILQRSQFQMGRGGAHAATGASGVPRRAVRPLGAHRLFATDDDQGRDQRITGRGNPDNLRVHGWSVFRRGPVAYCIESVSAAYGAHPDGQAWEFDAVGGFGRVQPSQRGLVEWGQLLYDTAACYGMDGAPVWLNTGSLQLVAIHVGANFRNITNPDIPPQLGVALALRSEILDLLRQRVALAGIRPAF